MREPFVLKLKNGDQLTLRYPFSAIRRFEKLTGGHFFSDSLNSLGAEYICGLIAAGMGPGSKMDDVERKIDMHLEAGGDLADIMNQSTAALRQWGILGRDEDEEAAKAANVDEVPTRATDPGD